MRSYDRLSFRNYSFIIFYLISLLFPQTLLHILPDERGAQDSQEVNYWIWFFGRFFIGFWKSSVSHPFVFYVWVGSTVEKVTFFVSIDNLKNRCGPIALIYSFSTPSVCHSYLCRPPPPTTLTSYDLPFITSVAILVKVWALHLIKMNLNICWLPFSLAWTNASLLHWWLRWSASVGLILGGLRCWAYDGE